MPFAILMVMLPHDRFSHQNYYKTGAELDLAIQGEGLFVLGYQERLFYTRLGNFGINRNGYIDNYYGEKVLGFLANANEQITEIFGPLFVVESLLAKATSEINITFNLDAGCKFTSFKSNTFNIYDSLGCQHELVLCFHRLSLAGSWRLQVIIDKVDATPMPEQIPQGLGSPTMPLEYHGDGCARPFTLCFSPKGKLIPHDPYDFARFFGGAPVIGDEITVALDEKLKNNDLILNEVPIIFPAKENTIYNIAKAINASSDKHQVHAEALLGKDETQRGKLYLTIDNFQTLTISGDAPEKFGLNFGIQSGIEQDFSDQIAFDVCFNSGVCKQHIKINLQDCTQFALPYVVEECMRKDHFIVKKFQQNGYATGKFVKISVNSAGIVKGIYDNGQTITFGQIALAKITAENNLMPYERYAWQTLYVNEELAIDEPGSQVRGFIKSGYLENIKLRGEKLTMVPENYLESAEYEHKEDDAKSLGLNLSLDVIKDDIKIRRFNQGILYETGGRFDLGINGEGFFQLCGYTDNMPLLYSRFGNFEVDKNNYLTNYHGCKVVGFLADASGNITNECGLLQLDAASLAPKATKNVRMDVNLNAGMSLPVSNFITGFTPTNKPSPTTFNNSVATQIFDTLGNPHILTTYFAKAPAERTWNTYVSIDNSDVTPAAAEIPVGGVPTAPASYSSGDIALPFTMVFSETGKLVANKTSSPPQHFGDPPVLSADSLTALDDSGSLPRLDIGYLTINGVPISIASTTDTVSTTDNGASIITIVDAINFTSFIPNNLNRSHGVVATKCDTTWDAAGGTYTTTALATGDLTINGVNIVGAPDTANAAGLANLINSIGGVGVPGVFATVNGKNELRLIAGDGRNICLQTDGSTTSTIRLGSEFDLNGGSALDKVKRGQFSLSIANNRGITIGGNAPEKVGLVAGLQAGIFQDNSDIVAVDFNPAGGAAQQRINIDFSNCTQFASPFSVATLSQDGYGIGRLISMDVDPAGIISGRYGNGQSKFLGQVGLVKIPDPRYLIKAMHNCWCAIDERAGGNEVALARPGINSLGLILSGHLEDISNHGYDAFPFTRPSKLVKFDYDADADDDILEVRADEHVDDYGSDYHENNDGCKQGDNCKESDDCKHSGEVIKYIT